MILHGDNLIKLRELESNSVDMVYLDPPFFSQTVHRLSSRERRDFEFSDIWPHLDSYTTFVEARLVECHRLMRPTASIFLHCDRSASHHLRLVLERVFGPSNFRSEIIWAYRRWSNSKKGLLGAHQTIFFFSKTAEFKFNQMYEPYSATTNVDQILQKRQRNGDGKAEYKRNESGEIEIGGAKRGVPLSDVWTLPYLNPKAAERTGYPTQKPVHLLRRLIELVTDKDDLVLDPFCGSGTTAVAAQLLSRRFIAIDCSEKAIRMTQERLAAPFNSESRLLQEGESAFVNQSSEVMRLLALIDAIVVQRNSGIDGFLKQEWDGKPIAVRVQRDWETVTDARAVFRRACRDKGCGRRILIVTNQTSNLLAENLDPDEPDLIMLDALHLSIERALSTA
jgi:site-specific DNA-methyltransferase (adenine-specific)